MKRFSLVKTIKLLALQSVLKPNEDYFLRKVFRFYSKRFHTPLHEVYDLPLDEVLIHYFESKYEELKEADDETELVNEMIYVTETDEERRQREKEEESTEVSDEEYLKSVMEEENLKQKNKIENIKPIDRPALTIANRDKSEVELPKPEMPEIKMEFISKEDMEALGEFDIFGDPKKS